MAWQPLESNPDVMNKLLHKLGVPLKWEVCDVYGLDDELLSTVPQPVLALILLFPTSDKYEEHKTQQEAAVLDKGQTTSPKLFYLKQYVHNACGTIALIHAVANNDDQIVLGDGYLKQFLDDSRDLSPEERGNLLQNCEGIISTHEEVVEEGQTVAPPATEKINFHFVAFIQKDGDLYELDGRKSFPINHGPSKPETLLQDAAKVVRRYLARDPDEIHFSTVALTAAL